MRDEDLTLIGRGLGDALAEARKRDKSDCEWYSEGRDVLWHARFYAHSTSASAVHLAIGCIARRLRETGDMDGAKRVRRIADAVAADWETRK